jgi:agmatine deiminase
MPVQVGKDKFVQFRYDPSYLKGKKEWEDSRTDTKEMCRANAINPVISDVNLDGGNVLGFSDRAIISDRVFSENPEYTDKTKLIAEIKERLEVNEIIVIPSQRSDFTGQADGMVRFVDCNTILGNDRAREYKYWRDSINTVIEKHRLKYIDVPFLEDRKHSDSAIGIYVNYLEVKDLIVLPVFEVPGNKDDEAVRLFKEIFWDRKIETINYSDVALHGGLLNCTTWTVFE